MVALFYMYSSICLSVCLCSVYLPHVMHGSRTFCERGSNSDVVFFCFVFVDEGREDPNTIISGSS